MEDYSSNCDYLRKRFGLTEYDGIYKLIGIIADEYRQIDAIEEEKKLAKEVEKVKRDGKKKVAKKSTKGKKK